MGFDRIVFKGMIIPTMHATGMTSFLVARRVRITFLTTVANLTL